MFEMKDESCTIKVYNLLADTREFIGVGDAYIAARTGLPADCTDIAPPDASAGNVSVFNDKAQKWEIVEDHRGKVVYSMQDGSAATVSNLGQLPPNTTLIAPSTPYDEWDGSKWTTNEGAQQQAHVNEANGQKLALSGEASERISTLSDAVELEMASDAEQAVLTEWKKYRVLLSRIDTSSAPNIDWPARPE